jgi:hypothetical protein
MKRQEHHNQPKPHARTHAGAPDRTGTGGAVVRLIEFVQAHLKTIVRLCLAVLALLVVVDAIPGLIGKEHAHTAAERFPGFWAIFGFAGCVVIILVSKAFGHAGIMQREDYYDE